ncbi:MAG: hypothetical protein ABI112_18525 [Terracoccus sp.]
MHNIALALEGAWKVLLAGLLLGAGLPAIFALGIRSLALNDGGRTVTATDGTSTGDGPASPLGKVLATLCFALVLLGVVLGITFIVASGFGKALSFEHLYPTLVNK